MAGPVERRELVVDGLLAVALAGLSVVLVAGVVDGTARQVAATALASGHVAPIVVRRRWPLAGLVVMAVTALLTVPVGVPLVTLGPAVLVGIYTVGQRVDPVRSRQALVATILVMAIAVSANGMSAGTVASNAVGIGACWWLGDRARRTVAEAQAHREAAEAAAQRAVAAERLRIARELHDVVAHAMSVIAVQAGTGRFVIDESPGVAREALASIETTSRAALDEMRRLLAVLRDDGASAGELGPTPGVHDIGELARATTAAAGIRVEVRTSGEPVPLPPGIDLCLYRIAQEALTNVRRHAGASVVAVTVSYEPGRVGLEVVDNGVGAGAGPGPTATPGAGQGHVGMRERVSLYGGRLEVGPRPGGGYRVAATLPHGGTP